MKSSKNANFRSDKHRYMIIAAAVLLISAVFFASLFNSNNPIALADDRQTSLANDTFSVLFPTVSYIQADDPTLIAANESYLIIYDKTESAMFVRGGDRIGTYAFPLDIENVEYIKAVGNTAFIHADGENYTVDISNTSATPIKRELSSPENANYFRSDGKYLYAKNGYGAISIYDENLEIVTFEYEAEDGTKSVTVDNHTYVDSTSNPVFAGEQVLAGNNHLLYFFKTVQSDPYFIVYDPVLQKELVNEFMHNYITEAYVGDNIIVGQLARGLDETKNTRLVGIDKNTGATLFPSDITPDSFCVFGDRLYTIEGKQIMTYTLEKSADGAYTGFRKISTISMAGDDAYHLDSPNDVAVFGADLAVADTDNKRVGFINSASIMTSIELNASPLRITSDKTGVYALCDNQKVYKIESNQIVQTLTTEGAVDITYLDKLYFIDENGLYTLLGGEKLPLAEIQNARRLTSAKDGTNLYLLKDNSIEVYTVNGTHICSLTGDFNDVKDISVDYAGQIFALRENGFDVYINENGSLIKFSSTDFYNATAHVKANSVCVEDSSLYFSSFECLIGKSEVKAYSKDSYISAPYVPAGNVPYRFAKLKENATSFAIPSDGRMEGIFPAPAETVLILESGKMDGGFEYALLNGEFFKVRLSDFENVDINNKEGDYAAKRNTYLYAYPGTDNGKIQALSGTRFDLVSDCADFENSKWLRVLYNEKIYFIASDDCDEYIELIPEENRKYGRAKAKRVGGLVGIYADATDGAEVLLQIVDGTQIEVLDALDKYYLIRYNNTVGYMLKTEVQIDGLTTVQIISIVVACIVAVAGVGIFIAIEITKKKSLEAQRKAEKKQK
ncbi:MAG: hypothetical protein HFE29_00510 [Clostridia bacterium]|nr:hypothetical protein [Clostridia bacterium]